MGRGDSLSLSSSLREEGLWELGGRGLPDSKGVARVRWKGLRELGVARVKGGCPSLTSAMDGFAVRV